MVQLKNLPTWSSMPASRQAARSEAMALAVMAMMASVQLQLLAMTRGGVAVHDRHLHIHEHGVEGRLGIAHRLRATFAIVGQDHLCRLPVAGPRTIWLILLSSTTRRMPVRRAGAGRPSGARFGQLCTAAVVHHRIAQHAGRGRFDQENR